MEQKNLVRLRRTARPASFERARHVPASPEHDLWQQLVRADTRAQRSAAAMRLRGQLARCDAQHLAFHDKLSLRVLVGIVDFVEEVLATPVARTDHDL